MQASDLPPKQGGERPHKRLSKFDPFRTTRAAGSGKPEMMPFLHYPCMGLLVAVLPWSMSSIKRDVKKKLLPRPEAEKIFVSTSSPLSVSAPDSPRGILLWLVCPSSGFHLSAVTTPIES
jgi:hypothetical protein